MDVRPATQADEPRLFEIHKSVFRNYIEQIWGWDEDWQRYNFKEECAASVTSVIEVDGWIAGYLQVRYEDNRILLQNIALASGFQGKDIGTRLVKGLQQEATLQNKPVELGVFRSNSGAIRFYRRLGFHRTGETVSHIMMSYEM